MNISPDDLDTLAGDEVSELFGWPVGLLDHLASIQNAAYRDEITIHEWRRQDAELRATGPAQFPSDQIYATGQAAKEAWLGHVDEDASGKRMERLVNRLRAATNAAPDDDGLRQRLGRLDELIAEERTPAVVGQLRKAQARIYRWLVTSGKYR
jgi:hypothetical protein